MGCTALTEDDRMLGVARTELDHRGSETTLQGLSGVPDVTDLPPLPPGTTLVEKRSKPRKRRRIGRRWAYCGATGRRARRRVPRPGIDY